jgi:hypothetical protein
VKNLAGDHDCDAQIVGELALAGIQHERIDHEPKGEVPAHYRGSLTLRGVGTLTFERAWCYWVVQGSIPLAISQRLYADPVGRTDVRVAGHAAAPPPEYPWVDFYRDGKQLLPKFAEQEILELEVRGEALPPAFRRIVEDARRTTRYVDDPAVGDGFVHLYHVDSQEGLNLLIEVLREAVAQQEGAA